MSFATHLARRILSSIPPLLGISVILYGILHLALGGPVDIYADNPSVSPEALKNLEHELGLDQPVPIQYLRWSWGAKAASAESAARQSRPSRTRAPASLAAF